VFIFGTTEEIARSLCESIEQYTPGLVDKPVDEMTSNELKQSLTIFRIAAYRAREVGSSQESVDLLMDWHDEALKALLVADERMRKYVLSGKYSYPRQRSAENRAYYQSLARNSA